MREADAAAGWPATGLAVVSAVPATLPPRG